MKNGQALVSLIVVVAISIIIIMSTITLIATNSINATINQQSYLVRQAAESGIENALLRLLRDPTYTGETIPSDINDFETVVSVSGDEINKTIISTASSFNYQRKIMVKITYNNNVMSIISWQDVQ